MGILNGTRLCGALLLAAASNILLACEAAPETTPDAASDVIAPVITQSWDQVRIGTYDSAEFARFFTEIGGYDIVSDEGSTLTLQQNGLGATILLEEMPAEAPQARPPDATSWDTGCYWSLMMRAKDVPSIVADAEALGWLPKTPVAYLEFGPSRLNVIVLTHQATGAQVQLYERLTTPLPEDYPAFERFGVPFNIMQMASDRDATYRFFTEQLGFATWYHGDPTTSSEPEIMPLGIPVELSTTVPYRASIVSPVAGMETGRFEMIEVMGTDVGLTGRDFSDTCTNDSVGLTHVIYRDVDLISIFETFAKNRKVYGREVVRLRQDGSGQIVDQTFRAPDGANIVFSARP